MDKAGKNKIDLEKIFREKKDKNAIRISVLWTIVFHLVALAIFLATQVSDTAPVKRQQVVIDFTEDEYNVEEEVEKEKKKRQELIEALVAKELSQDLKNIAVNRAEKTEVKSEKISTQEYLSELAKEYDFGDDYQDAVDALNSNNELELAEFRKKIKEKYKSVKYEGPTTIYYELKNRNDRYLYIPVYLCESSGKITLLISVGNNGSVLSAEPIPAECSTMDECLVKSAISSIKRSRFNAVSKPPVQSGKITYIFMPQ